MRSLSTTLSALTLLTLLTGCAREHGPLSNTPDTTSLGVAKGLGPGGVSTAFGVYPDSPGLKGVDPLADRSTSTAVRPPPLVPGMPANPDAPRTSNAVQAWTTGPNLPVEPSNMALEPETIEEPKAQGQAPGHQG
jgi:hypothetical protein